MGQIIAFFRAFMTENEENEALALIYWDKVKQEFFAYVPKQTVCKVEIEANLHDCPYDDAERYICYADIHSHNSMDAFFSSKDDSDERSTGLYFVLGKLDQFYPDIKARIFCGDTFAPIDPDTVIEGLEQQFPVEWLDQVTIQKKKGARLEKNSDKKWGLPRYSGGGGVMKFPMDRPVKVVMLGAGGTGGYVAPYVFRLLHMLGRPARFIICDGDIVEPKNLDRQNFVPADLGENKARVLAERYSTVLGIETEYVPNFIEKLPDLMELSSRRMGAAAPTPAAGQRKWCCCSAAWTTTRPGSSAIRRFIRVRNLFTSTVATGNTPDRWCAACGEMDTPCENPLAASIRKCSRTPISSRPN